MLAEKLGRCLLQTVEIEGPAAVPDEGREHRRADALGAGRRAGFRFGKDRSGKDAVLVGLAQDAVAGVEACGNRLDAEDANAGGQRAVEGAMQVGGGDGRGDREGCNLRERVDAGIGAAGALGQHALAGHVGDGLGKRALNGGEMRLDLPPVKGGAVVGKDGLPVLHGLFGR